MVSDTTFVNRTFGVRLAPDRAGAGLPGQTINYTHTLTNLGNYTDTFAFTSYVTYTPSTYGQLWSVTRRIS